MLCLYFTRYDTDTYILYRKTLYICTSGNWTLIQLHHTRLSYKIQITSVTANVRSSLSRVHVN